MEGRIFKIIAFFYKMGIQWSVNRVWYALKLKSPYFSIWDKKILPKVNKFTAWHTCFSSGIALVSDTFSTQCQMKADNVLNGVFQAFSHSNVNYKLNEKMNWHYQPITKQQVVRTLSWHKIPDFGKVGDIKLIWEASRFSFVVDFIQAYNQTQDEKYARGCIDLMINWVKENPYPLGVNYKCGQEVSFRLFMWILALTHFDRYITDEEKEILYKNCYISLLRIDANISYATKCVKNNHSISESAGLLIGGLFFSGFPESKRWVAKGEKSLLKETAYQIEDDGSYIQHSFNYHRLTMDVLSFSFWISHQLGYEASTVLKQRHKQLYQFISAFVDKNGSVPNYGSNDGAYLFPLTNYPDFRSSINFASAINERKIMFQGNDAHIRFFGINNTTVLEKIHNFSFPQSGYIQLINKEQRIFIRCSKYKNRPAHSDAMHVDINIGGKNIFCDSGTFSYNTDPDLKKQFVSICGHNTVCIGNKDYLIPVLNFGAVNWPNAKVVESTNNYFYGINYGYKKDTGIIHHREVFLQEDCILIKDKLEGVKKQILASQMWHTEYPVKKINDYTLFVEKYKITSNVKVEVDDCLISIYYNSTIEGKKISFKENIFSDFIIETKITTI